MANVTYHQKRGATPLTVAILLVIGLALAITVAMIFLRFLSPNEPQGEIELPVEELSYFDEAAGLDDPNGKATPLSETVLERIIDDGTVAYDYFGNEASEIFIPERILDHPEIALTTQQRQTIEAEQERVRTQASELASQLLQQERDLEETATAESVEEDTIRAQTQTNSQTFAQLRTLILTSKQTIRDTLTREQIAQLGQ